MHWKYISKIFNIYSIYTGKTQANGGLPPEARSSLVSDVMIMMYPELWFPASITGDDVWSFIYKWKQAKGIHAPVPLGCVCGRGVILGFVSNCLQWPSFIGFYLLASWSCSCEGKEIDMPGNLAHYNNALWLYNIQKYTGNIQYIYISKIFKKSKIWIMEIWYIIK